MSVDISRGQYLLLKKFCKNNASAESLDSEQLSDCNYLVKCGYLKAIKELKSYEQTVCGVRPIAAIASLTTTASGRAAIYSFKATFYKWWIPVIISIASLIVSIIALLIKIL